MVPDGATQGQTADLLVQAVDTADPTMQSLAHLFVTVDLESQHPSDSAAVAELQGGLQGEKKTPGLELAILGLAILVLAIRRRRA
jgi:hypothetical protein